MNFLRKMKKMMVRGLKPGVMMQTRSTRPASDVYGYDRGRPIDRYYIDRFFAAHADEIRGDIIEIQDPIYTAKHGTSIVSQSVLDIDPSNENATVVADLTAADNVPSDSYDCFILPQTLQFIYDVPAALYHAHRILRPGGVLLSTVPALSRVDPELYESDFWRFTPASCERLLRQTFGPQGVVVSSFGNALSCTAFINGMSVEDFSASELDPVDSFFPLIISIRARKAMRPN